MKKLLLCLLLSAAACLPGRPPVIIPPPPVVVVPPAPEPEPQQPPEPEPPPASVERATGADLLRIRGNYANLYDPETFQPIYDPALPGVDEATLDRWLATHRANGTTHVFIGPLQAGVTYPGIPWTNPDWLNNPAGVRAFVERLLATPSADGKGFRPVIFLGPDFDVRPYIEQWWPGIAAALDGLQDFIIYVPGWEPVIGGWPSADVSYALTRGKALFGPSSHWFLHLSPGRPTAASNPPEANDPWQSDEAGMWFSHGGQYLEGLLYQTEHGRAVHEPCSAARSVPKVVDGVSGLAWPADCWANRFDDIVARLGAGFCSNDIGHGYPCGWRRVIVVLFETVGYESIRLQTQPGVDRRVATDGKRICDHYGVVCGFGNGLPID